MKTHAKYDSHGGGGVQVLLFQRAGNKMRQMWTGCVREPGEWGGPKMPAQQTFVLRTRQRECHFTCRMGLQLFAGHFGFSAELVK